MKFGSPLSHDATTSAAGSPAKGDTNIGADEKIPTEHLLLEPSAAEPFSDWMDGQLQQLEENLSDFCTPKSIKVSLAR